MSHIISEQSTPDLAQISSKTGLVVRSTTTAAMDRLFAELEKYDAEERSDTFEYLRRALNETRTSLGAEPAYQDE
jgi:hypothetical protein